MARKKDEGGVGSSGRLSPVDVQQIQFKRALRGYDEQEVDDFLDRITEELTQLIDERRSATERAGSLPTVRVASAGDAAAASRQAEELVRQARERADAIIRDAQQRAAAIAAGAPAAGGAAPAGSSQAAIAGFVAKERDFLQRLAALVQGHAEGVKSMVATARDAGAQAQGGSASSASGGTGPVGASGPAAGSGAGGVGSSGAGFGGPGATADPGGRSGSGSSAPGGASTSQGPAGSASSGFGGPGPAASSAESAARGSTAVATEPRPAPTDRPGNGDAPSLPGLPQPPPELSGPIDASASVREQTAPRPVPEPSSADAEGHNADAGAADAQESSLRELFWGED